jgi:potassium efflux system protein
VTDVVTFEGQTGEVTRIGIRSLTVAMYDRKELIIPNSAVIGNTFTNWTRTDDTTREVLNFTVSYRDDPAEAARLVQNAAIRTRGVLQTPAPKATVYDFIDRGVTIRLQYFTLLRGSYSGLDVRAEILDGVYEAFREAGFTMPTPLGEVRLSLPREDAPAALPAPA